MLTSAHLSFDQLADMVQSRLLPAQRAQAQAHIANCQQCLATLTHIRQVVGLMRDYDAEDAPEHVIARAVPLLRQHILAGSSTHESARPSLPQRIIAALRFDGLQQPAPALRAGRPALRQLLFDAGQYDVDLRIAPSGSAWAVSGQVLGPHTSGQIELRGPAEVMQAELSELSRFRFPPIPAGRYTLNLRLDTAEVEIADLEVGS
jgi:anti-sigma factor RsiW